MNSACPSRGTFLRTYHCGKRLMPDKSVLNTCRFPCHVRRGSLPPKFGVYAQSQCSHYTHLGAGNDTKRHPLRGRHAISDLEVRPGVFIEKLGTEDPRSAL